MYTVRPSTSKEELMALIQVNYLSKALFRTVPVNVVLPVDKISFETMDYLGAPEEGFPVLFLLHGLLGNYTDWVSGTRIQRWAEDAGLAVVMPSGDNAFYVPGLTPNNDYGTFIGQELPQVMRQMFPLSHRREDTFIAGLSMGGFGAIRNGMKYAETFSRIVDLSSGIHFFDPDFASVAGEEGVFGDLKEAAKTDKNHYVAYADMKARIEAGEFAAPEFYLACGTDDPLMDVNVRFRDLLVADGLAVTWDEEPRGHDWDFWDSQIKKVVDWLPLGEKNATMGSGNVSRDL